MSPQDQLFSEIALSLGLLDAAQIERCRHVIATSIEERDLASIALELGMLGSGDLEAIKKQQAELEQRRQKTPASTAARRTPASGRTRPPSSQDTAPEEDLPTLRRGSVDARAPTLQALQAPTPPSVGLVPRTAPAPPSERFVRQMPRRAAVAERAVALQALRDEAAVPMPYLHKALKLALGEGASDLHVHPSTPLRIRHNGQLRPFQGDTALSAEAIEKILAQVLTDAEWEHLGRTGEVQTAIEAPGIARGRLHAFRTRAGLGVVIRVVPRDPPELESLDLPETLGGMLQNRRGLLVITGPRSSGKTTVLAAAARSLLTARRPVHVVETLAEFRLDRIGPFATQCRGSAPARWHRSALRSGATLFVADLDSAGHLALALEAASEGTPVVACLEAVDAEDARHRLWLTAKDEALRCELAEHLTAIVTVRRNPLTPVQLEGEVTVPTELMRRELREASGLRQGVRSDVVGVGR